MYTKQDVLRDAGYTEGKYHAPDEKLKERIVTEVQSVLGEHKVSLEEFKMSSKRQRERILKIVTLSICHSEDEFELFWESLASGHLVCVVENGREIKFHTPFDSVENYQNLLEALHYFEYKKHTLHSKNLH